MKFKEWLKLKEGTDTACIAGFARPIGAMVRRPHIPFFGQDEKKKKKLERPANP